MSPDNTINLTRLLTTFDAQRLGEGDVSAGANVLAAMACAIANIHRHGTRLTSGDGPSFQIGCSLLATGPLTAALVGERVTSVLAEYQSNLSQHRSEWEAAINQYGKTIPGGYAADDRFTVDPDIRSLSVLKEELIEVGPALSELLRSVRRSHKRALLDQPLVFATGASPAKLGAALERSHCGQLLVHDTLHDPAQFADLAHCCLPLIDGCLTVGPLASPVRGHLLLRDPSLVIEEALRVGGDGTRLLLRLPWLVDGNAGPALSIANDATAMHPRLDAMEERYRLALANAWVRRLDYTAEEPQNLDFDITTFQARWIRFLQDKETTFPGISATARPLLATLLFGLLEMVRSHPTEDAAKLHAEDVEALAQTLVLRMCNTRAVILHDAAKESRERKLQMMLEKLSEDPACVRELVRKFHRLPTHEARDLLSELAARGQAIDLGDDRFRLAPAHWNLKTPVLTLEA